MLNDYTYAPVEHDAVLPKPHLGTLAYLRLPFVDVECIAEKAQLGYRDLILFRVQCL
jgi:hypothetical protein